MVPLTLPILHCYLNSTSRVFKLNNQDLWCGIVKLIHGHNCGIHQTLDLKRRIRYSLKTSINLMPMFKTNIVDGKDTSFCSENWLGDETLASKARIFIK